MSATPTDPPPSRPSMRRKSSAQNLLSSFKSPPLPTSTPSTSTFFQQQHHPHAHHAHAYSNASASAVGTPSGSNPVLAQGGSSNAREWDAQSVHSSVEHHSQSHIIPSQNPSGSGGLSGSAGAGAAGVQSPLLNQGPSASVDSIRDMLQKRIITLTYIRNIHQGQSHWFHTVLVSRQDLDRVFNNTEMKKRANRFAALGMSLSNLLDIQNPTDLLRALVGTLAEYDQTKEDTDKPKMRALFKGNKNKRQTGGFAEYTTASYIDAGDTSYLTCPHFPFQLDYHEVLLTLLDVLSETYSRLSKFLGPSLFPRDHAQQYMLGALGILTPHPGVSYLFAHPSTQSHPTQSQSQHPISNYGLNHSHGQGQGKGSKGAAPNTPYMTDEMRAERADPASLWSIANAGGSGTGLGGGGARAGTHHFGMAGGPTSPPAVQWTAAMSEMVMKVDGKMKKITAMLLKELDAFARNSIKDELASLDPMLRNMGGGGLPVTQELYDFEA